MLRFKLLIAVYIVFSMIGTVKSDDLCSHGLRIIIRKPNRFAFDSGQSSIMVPANSVKKDLKSGNAPSLKLGWTSDPSTKKITVSTDLNFTKINLQVKAENCKGCVSEGKISIRDFDQDLITISSKKEGHCGLEYSLIGNSPDQNDAGTPSVIYTVIDVN